MGNKIGILLIHYRMHAEACLLVAILPQVNRAIKWIRYENTIMMFIYCQTSNIRHILVGNNIVDHSDVVGASPVSAAPTTSSFST